MSAAMPSVPYWRLSSFYCFYFALLGAWLPFWPLYLQAHNFNATDIGYLAGIIMGTKIFAPNLWGWLCRHQRKPISAVRLGAFLACLCFAFIFLEQSFLNLALVVASFSFFWNAILAQFEVITLDHLSGETERYSQIRVWGSLGFIAAVAGLGWGFDIYSVNYLPWVLMALLLAIWFSSLLVAAPTQPQQAPQSAQPLLSIIKQPAVLAFLVCCFLQQLSHGPYYTFFSLFLEGKGYKNSFIGMMWSLGVLAEVLLFIVMYRLLHRFSLRHIMLGSIALSALRWLLIAYWADNTACLIIAQCLHAASFGSFHAFAVEMVRRCFSGGHQGQGMALYSGVSFGAGGALGAVLSGWAWDISQQYTFVAAALVCVLAFVIGLKVRINP
ncbi:MFS transporter [Dasania sp. GY-MA-18]|uniref:MFS transporter n=1 Tax=Dasania phycosphaerae TaxID=2950436 RepID=A0A9J6RKQ3_9GAMM|nr:MULTISPECIES: MFS transporter [Dasania]MCR8922567.1 MFS transporter [Dasania sp. GY-MA-18]MCZ0864996.1 MFS transporter [Dasania phycosphaerae]MCZ0868723.1 MFS transporter [Dasania phycosphaerae]